MEIPTDEPSGAYPWVEASSVLAGKVIDAVMALEERVKQLEDLVVALLEQEFASPELSGELTPDQQRLARACRAAHQLRQPPSTPS